MNMISSWIMECKWWNRRSPFQTKFKRLSRTVTGINFIVRTREKEYWFRECYILPFYNFHDFALIFNNFKLHNLCNKYNVCKELRQKRKMLARAKRQFNVPDQSEGESTDHSTLTNVSRISCPRILNTLQVNISDKFFSSHEEMLNFYFRDMIVDCYWTDHFWFAQKRLIANNSWKQNHLIPTGNLRIGRYIEIITSCHLRDLTGRSWFT